MDNKRLLETAVNMNKAMAEFLNAMGMDKSKPATNVSKPINVEEALDNLGGIFGKDYATKIKERFWQVLREEPLNILIVGGSGSGKSSTIRALLKANNPQEEKNMPLVGEGAKPMTMDIEKYEINKNITIYDSPGLGDGQKDEQHKRKIQDLLQEKTIRVMRLLT